MARPAAVAASNGTGVEILPDTDGEPDRDQEAEESDDDDDELGEIILPHDFHGLFEGLYRAVSAMNSSYTYFICIDGSYFTDGHNILFFIGKQPGIQDPKDAQDGEHAKDNPFPICQGPSDSLPWLAQSPAEGFVVRFYMSLLLVGFAMQKKLGRFIDLLI